MTHKKQSFHSVGELITSGSSIHHHLVAEKLLTLVSPYRKMLFAHRSKSLESELKCQNNIKKQKTKV